MALPGSSPVPDEKQTLGSFICARSGGSWPALASVFNLSVSSPGSTSVLPMPHPCLCLASVVGFSPAPLGLSHSVARRLCDC